jgi:hypothetical protein
VRDQQITLPPIGGSYNARDRDYWTPKNADGDGGGITTLRRGPPGRSGSPAGLADRALYRQRRGAARCAAALHRPDHRRRQARSLTAFPNPQRMLVASNPVSIYAPRAPIQRSAGVTRQARGPRVRRWAKNVLDRTAGHCIAPAMGIATRQGGVGRRKSCREAKRLFLDPSAARIFLIPVAVVIRVDRRAIFVIVPERTEETSLENGG